MQARSQPGSTPNRFDREKFFPKGWEDCEAQFLELFHRYAYIYKSLAGGSWYSAEENWKLTDSEILKAIACAHPKLFIGSRAGKTTRYAVLDIDAKSKYHSKPQLDKLLTVLAKAGLSKSQLYRSSYSGGWHLYLFFEEAINSTELRRHLLNLLTLNDFEVSRGTLEIFPNRGDSSLGMGLRLPLQPGFAWLDKRDLEVQYERAELSATKALEFFIDALESDANSFSSYRQLKTHVQELEALKAKARTHAVPGNNVVPLRLEKNVPPAEFADFVAGIFGHLPPGIIADNWYKGRLFHLHGLTGESQRAEAIICVGHYFFYGDPSRDLAALGYGYTQEREWALQHFLSSRHNGKSKDINGGRADALAQVERAVNWTPPHKKSADIIKYSIERPVSWIRENENRQKNARSRIQKALDNIRAQQRAFTTVELQKSAGCSRETLYNHQDIWRATYEDRKNYRDLAAGFFANCTDEYNDAVGADCPQIEPPSASLSKITPPGLLAARQIALEIAMRNRRDIKRSQKKKQSFVQAETCDWVEQVNALTSALPEELTIQKIKMLLVVLANLLGLSPTKEDEVTLVKYIGRLRLEISKRSNGPTPVPSEYG